uniref:Charged multivesicular body protein 7 n=1 Tax=Compsopogon caeruleus TaxID=31354 RepID=A0A6T6CBJ0_9RHOD
MKKLGLDGEDLSEEEREVLWCAELPLDRETDAALWDRLTSFFRDLVMAWMARPGYRVVSRVEILEGLRWRGKEPTCGHAVLDWMVSEKVLLRVSRLPRLEGYVSVVVEESSVTNPGEAQVQSGRWRRVPEQVFRAVYRQISHVSGRFLAPTDDPNTKVVVANRLEVDAESLLRANEEIGLVLFHEVVSQSCGGNKDEGSVLLGHLAASKKASARYVNQGSELLVKLGSSPINDVDLGLYRLMQGRQRLKETEEQVSEKVTSLGREVLLVLRNKTLADKDKKSRGLHLMRLKKLGEERLYQTREMIVALEKSASAIESAQSVTGAIAAVSEGNRVLSLVRSDANPEKVDEAFLDFEEALEHQRELDDVLHRNAELLTGTLVSDSDVETEWQTLLASVTEPKTDNPILNQNVQSVPGSTPETSGVIEPSTLQVVADEKPRRRDNENSTHVLPKPTTSKDSIDETTTKAPVDDIPASPDVIDELTSRIQGMRVARQV